MRASSRLDTLDLTASYKTMETTLLNWTYLLIFGAGGSMTSSTHPYYKCTSLMTTIYFRAGLTAKWLISSTETMNGL